MRKKHKTNRNRKATSLLTNKRNFPLAKIIVLVLVVAVSIGFWIWKTNNLAAANIDFEKLRGKWLRPDGGYVLEVKQVAADGKMDTAYLNPKPINVSKALAYSEAGQTKVFVELRDRLYPGSYYTLTYNTAKDQLAGVYHHLGLNQQFDVVFVRMK